MQSLADVWPDTPAVLGDPIILTESLAPPVSKPVAPPVPAPTPAQTQPPAIPPQTPAAPPTKPFIRPTPARAGEPDAGVMGVHTIVQGMITYQPGQVQYSLAPWQIIPFGEGFEFIAENMHVLYHRGVYQVGNNGVPLPEGPVSPASFARNSWTSFTPADSICGFSGHKFERSKLTLDRLQHIHGMSADDAESPWSATAFVPGQDMVGVLPRFWVELDDTPGNFNPAAPFEHLWDVTSRRKIKVVPFQHWHLLAPMPGVAPSDVLTCADNLGRRFLMNRIYLGGTGWRSGRATASAGPEPMLLAELTNPNVNQKLHSVILPCLRSTGKSGSSNDVQNEIFSRPSAPALRRLLGDDGSPSVSCF